MILTPNLFVDADSQPEPVFGIRNTARPDQYAYLMVVVYNNLGEFLGEVILTQENLNTLSSELPPDEFIYIVKDKDAVAKRRFGSPREFKESIRLEELTELAQFIVKRGCIGAPNHHNRYGKKKTITPTSSGCTFRVIASV